MTFSPAKPRHILHFAGKPYELECNFTLIEGIENALQDDIVRIANRVMELSVTDTSRLIATALTLSGHKTTVTDVGKAIVEEIGVSGTEYAGVKLSLYAFIRICVAPPPEREGVAKDMGERIAKWSRDSLGENTSASA